MGHMSVRDLFTGAALTVFLAMAAWPGTTAFAQQNTDAENSNAAKPLPVPEPVRAITPLERHYSERAGEELHLFGASLRQEASTASQADLQPLGQIDDEYRLGPGDKLTIRLRGARNADRQVEIDRQGELALEELPPLPAAGLTLGELKQVLAESVAARFLDTDAFVSLASIREIPVSVSGAVRQPGTIRTTSLATIMDALTAAGGIAEMGSLRSILIISSDGRSRAIDLYDLLLGGTGEASRTRLQAGDRLHVPPIGPTIAISGAVKRAGIFELAAGEATVTLDEAMIFAAGPLYPGAEAVSLARLTAEGMEQTLPLDTGQSLRDGDLVLFRIPQPVSTGRLEVSGYSGSKGAVPLDQAVSLARLLRLPGVILPDTYPWLGVIERRPQPSGNPQYLPFAPNAVIAGTADRRLQDRDRVILFRADRFPLIEPEPKEASTRNDANEPDATAATEPEQPPLPPSLVSLIRGLEIDVDGPVQRLGRYPVAAPISGSAMLLLAGGVQAGANAGAANLIVAGGRSQDLSLPELETVMLDPGDALRLNGAEAPLPRSVRITGAVINPGRYVVQPGEHLSSLIERAGGLTREAFPDGAVFTRASERRREAERNQQAARELDQAAARVLATAEKPDRELVEMSHRLANELRDTRSLGRITVEADPEILISRPDLDPLLQDGDSVFFPERSLTVRVSGEVLSPVALQFVSGKTASDYLREAGGFTRLADTDRAFVVNPDGSARPLRISSWNYDPVVIQPGSTIVAPRDPKPFDAIELTANIGNILSQIAVTAASIAVITDNDD